MRSAITIAISGSACSGKTTLAYLLENLLQEVLVMQQNDFRNQSAGTSADSAENLDLAAFDKAIEDCQITGELPKVSSSEQGSKEVEAARHRAVDLVPEEARKTFKERLTVAVGPHRAIIVEGPLLYQDPSLLARANIRLFLRTSKSLARQRTTARPTHEGSEQTEAQFEQTVWPSYVSNSSFLFEKGDVEGTPKQNITDLMGVIVQPDIESSVPETLKWAVDAVCSVSEEEP